MHHLLIQKNTIKKLTNKQIIFFAEKLAHHSDFASKYSKVGESYEEFAIRLEKELNTPQKVEFYSSYLEKVGFKP